jgi:PAS domain-containing protein
MVTRIARPGLPPSVLQQALSSGQAGALLDQWLDHAGDVVLVMDGHGVVLDVRVRDAAFEKLAKKHWIARRWHDIVTVESTDKVQSLLDRALSGHPDAPRQVNHPAKTGPDWPVLYTAMAVGPAAAGASDKAVDQADRRIIASGRDLRDTMALQRQLVDAQQAMERDYWRFRDAESRYRSLFQTTSEGVLIVEGSSLRVVDANPAALTLITESHGKPVKAVGATMPSLFMPETNDAVVAAVAAARSTGKAETLEAWLTGAGLTVNLSITTLRQDDPPLLLVRLAPDRSSAANDPRAGRRHRAHQFASARAGREASPNAFNGHDANVHAASALVNATRDAVVFTDASGRITHTNRAFARMAQLANPEQAAGQMLDRWLGRNGVELQVLMTNLRDGGTPGLLDTQLRGSMDQLTQVEVSAVSLGGEWGHAFTLRDVGRRLSAPADTGRVAKSQSPSAAELSDLVGRVPLKQIVAETSDLIEKLSIETALRMTKDNRALAAQMLGLSRQSLYLKMHRYGVGGLTPDGVNPS